jgi:hypothetical protein
MQKCGSLFAEWWTGPSSTDSTAVGLLWSPKSENKQMMKILDVMKPNNIGSCWKGLRISFHVVPLFSKYFHFWVSFITFCNFTKRHINPSMTNNSWFVSNLAVIFGTPCILYSIAILV